MQRVIRRALPLYRRLSRRYPVLVAAINVARFHLHYNYANYWLHRVRGHSYREWYAHVLDQFARYGEAPPHEGFEAEMGQYQVDYLVEHGLKPSHTLLDYGCGYLRAGVHFVQYLEPGHYTGAEISAGRLAQGQRLVARLRLTDLRPRLVLLRGVTLTELGGQRYDVVWSHGVLSHMPIEDVRAFIAALPGVLNPGGAAYLNYVEAVSEDFEWIGLRHSAFRLPVFTEAAARAGLQCEPMDDWATAGHYGPEAARYVARDRMVRLTR
jgi:SAM-dependent methyltransferase